MRTCTQCSTLGCCYSLLFACCVISGKHLDLSELQLIHMKNYETMYVTDLLSPGPADDKVLVNMQNSVRSFLVLCGLAGCKTAAQPERPLPARLCNFKHWTRGRGLQRGGLRGPLGKRKSSSLEKKGNAKKTSVMSGLCPLSSYIARLRS
jgi:hypothetical protein